MARKNWADGPGGNTPVVAAELNRFEAGLVPASSVAPASPSVDDRWHDTSVDLIKRWNGSAWVAAGNGTYAPASTVVPVWQPSTAYTAGQRVVLPTGELATAKAAHTSGTSINVNNWNIVGGRPERAIPASVITRTSDVTLTANSAYGTPVDVRGRTRIRRARVKVGTTATGDLSVGITGTDKNLIVGTGQIAIPPAGVAEVAIKPTDIPVGPAELWLSSNVTPAIAGNGSQGDVLGSLRAPTSHPIPATITGVLAEPSALAVQVFPDDTTPISSGYTYSRTQMPVSCLGKIGTKLYGRNRTTDKWATSTDDGATWTDQTGPAMTTAFSGALAYWQLIGHGTYMFMVASNGKLYRATKDDFTTWADVSGPWRAGTTGRVGEITSDGTNLLYGCYNADSTWTSADVWRSTDNGATWTNVLSVAGARHTHAVAFDPATPTIAWASIGDDVATGAGLYKSTDSGVTWTKVSGSRYGIDLAFAYASQNANLANTLSRVVLEGDGTQAPHVFHYYLGNPSGSRTDPTIWPDTSPMDGKGSWGGTARAILVTTEGNLVYASTYEGGVAPNNYTRSGLWIAKGPYFTTPVLLEEFSPASSEPAWLKSYESGSYIINGSWRIPKPKFAGQ